MCFLLCYLQDAESLVGRILSSGYVCVDGIRDELGKDRFAEMRSGARTGRLWHGKDNRVKLFGLSGLTSVLR